MQHIQQPSKQSESTAIDWWTIAIVGGSWSGFMLLMLDTLGVMSLVIGLAISIIALIVKGLDVLNETFDII